MPSYKELLRLLREGKSPGQIAHLMKMRPSRWRRMLGGKRFRDALATEEKLAAVIAAHNISSGVNDAADRFAELLHSEKPETSRKVALALLHQGLAAARRQPARPGQAGAAEPACVLEPIDDGQLRSGRQVGRDEKSVAEDVLDT